MPAGIPSSRREFVDFKRPGQSLFDCPPQAGLYDGAMALKKLLYLAFGLVCAGSLTDAATAADAAPNRVLRIIVFGAHPDDCELQAGGVAAMWSAKGHKVKLVSTTNGDIGHWRDAGGPLAARRKAEVQKAAAILGIETEVLDIHDGELMPTLENRRLITRLIREWQADIVISPRPNDYHPDHRYTSILVQDAAYMVTVPFFCPDVPCLKRNPVFLYYPDGFQKPNPFQPDVAVSIEAVLERKLDALATLESQFYEGGANGSAQLVPSDPAEQRERRRQIRMALARRNEGLADRFRAKLVDFYGAERAGNVKHAEAFEICEYGRRPNLQELKQLFPFFETPSAAP
jgi:LmbE family N-acetylglucosaminyl deacetylase